jgi:protein-S-isoprenylcysteine O-methyltransferase Ste14
MDYYPAFGMGHRHRKGDIVKFSRLVIFCVATGLLYLGIPLLGWGLGDLEGYLSNNPRLGYALLVGLFSLAVGIQAYESTEGIRSRGGEKNKLVFRQRIVRVVLVLSLYVALFIIPFSDRRSVGVFSDSGLVRWLGIILSSVGFTFIFWSGVALGRQYSADVTIQKEQHLITAGAYRFIRHPRYFGVIALSIGISCIFRSWIGLVASIFFLATLIFRIKDEEATMHNEFGREWEAYCENTWRLIPYMY